MELEKRIRAFAALGNYIKNLSQDEFLHLASEAKRNNPWFTEDSVKASLKGIEVFLDEKELRNWLSVYHLKQEDGGKRVGIVMAGNIPLVGFHDFLVVLITGNIAIVKLSSNDNILLKKLTAKLIESEEGFKDQIEFVEKMQNLDAIIATGGDNSAKYFHYYFSSIPHIIRQNRVSCAILKGDETVRDLENFGLDILMYFGMGCRNVAKLYVPEGYKFDLLLEAVQKHLKLIDINKYYNNYDYNKSIFIVNKTPYLDAGFLLLTESTEMASPVSVVYYEYYKSEAEASLRIEAQKEKIQAVVSKGGWYPGSIDFGTAQTPCVSDYADAIDTVEFLMKLSK